jgi:hypothetical protein
MRQALVCGLLCVSVAACGGSSPTAPSGPQFPQVAGTYNGSINFTFPELGTSLSCPASTTVTQTGSNVSIAPIILSGQCVGLLGSIPLGSATIDTNGALPNQSGNFNEPSCGVYSAAGSGGFFGREFRISMTATSSTCWNFNFSASLFR